MKAVGCLSAVVAFSVIAGFSPAGAVEQSGALASQTQQTPRSTTQAVPGTSPKNPLQALTRDCPDVLLIGARGSGEAAEVDGKEIFGSLGPNVSQISAALYAALGPNVSYGSIPVIYSADSFDDLLPSAADLALAAGVLALPPPFNVAAGVTLFADYQLNHWGKFIASIQNGANAFVTEIVAQSVLCPNSALVIAGYSQGAMAAHDAEKMLALVGAKSVLSHIAGTILLADGDRVTNTTARDTFGTSIHSAQGIRPVYFLSIFGDVWDGPNTANICNANDVVCDYSVVSLAAGLVKNTINTHTQYTICPTGVLKVCGTGAALSDSSVAFVSPALINGTKFVAGRVTAKLASGSPATAKVLPAK